MACVCSWMTDSLRALVADLGIMDTRDVSLEVAEGYKTRIELLYRELLATELEQGTLLDGQVEVLSNLAKAYENMSELVDNLMSRVGTSTSFLCAPVALYGTVGRPTFQVPLEQLQCLIDYRFSVPQIAQLLSVSKRTIRRRIGLSIRSTYSQLSDDQLDEVVCAIQQQFLYSGNRQMYGHLVSRGIRVQYHRVRESQSRIDPEGTVLRRLKTLKRRTYSVEGPQHLWHIDGNHKLIRWKVVVHGGIDGYSRLIVYLKCSGNNRAASVMQSFSEAVQLYGVPSRVRADRGTENVQVSDYMVALHGCGRRSFIAGRSVHNQRIERLWRDVFSACLLTYHCVFSHMEESNILCVDNQIHLFSLHYVYIPRINESLQQFSSAWNDHPLSSMSNLSPNQLWLTGSHPDYTSNEALGTQLPGSDLLGIDLDGPIPHGRGNTVLVDPPEVPLSRQDYDVLCSLILPLEPSLEYGIDTYIKTVRFVCDHIN